MLRGIWGDGEYLYVIDASTLRRIRISDGDVTTLATHIHGPGSLWGDGNSILITQVGQLIRSSKAGELSMIADGLSGQPLGVWGDGTFAYQVDRGQILRISVATGEKHVVATIPGAEWIWGDGQSLWVLGWSGRAWKLSLDGKIESLMESGNSDSAGNILRLQGAHGIWGDGTNLYVSGSGVIYKLSPAAPGNTTSFEVPDRGAAVHTTAATVGTTIGHGRIELAAGAAAPAGMVIVAHFRHDGSRVFAASVRTNLCVDRRRGEHGTCDFEPQ
jgi:hypothetical protein